MLGDTAKTDFAALGGVKPQEQLHQGAFTATTGPDDGDFFSRRNGQVHLIQHRLVAIAETQALHFDADRLAPLERIDPSRVLRFVGARQQLIDARQGTAGCVIGVLQIKQLFDRTNHEPQVAKHRQHLADGQVGKQYREHRCRTKDVDAELEQQATGAARGVGFPLGIDRIVAHVPGTGAEATEEKALAVAGTDFLNRVQGLGQRLGEPRGAVVLQLLQVLDPLAQLHRGVDHQWVEQQNQQCELPVHPDQDRRRAHQRQHGHEEPAEGLADKLVDRVQVGDQVGGHRAAAQAFILSQGNALEALDQAQANAIHDVLGQARKQPRLHHVEQQRRATQGQGDQQHQADITGGALPGLGQRVVHHLQRRITIAQQHLIHQQRQQQGNRHAAQGRQDGDTVGDPQGFFMPQGEATDVCPTQPIDSLRWLFGVRPVIHRQHAPASGRAMGTAR